MASVSTDRMSWSRSYGRDRRRTYKGRYERIASLNPSATSTSPYRSSYRSPSAGRRSRRDTLDVEGHHSPSTSPSSSRYRASVSPSGGSYRESVSPSTGRLRATTSVDRDIGYERSRSYSGRSYTGRYSASVDREIGHNVQQSEKYFGVSQPSYGSYSSSEEYSSHRLRPRQSYSLDRGYMRSASLDRGHEMYDHTSHHLGQYQDYLSESRSNQDWDDSSYDARSTYSVPSRRTRAASVSRIGESIGDYEIVHRTRRASSVSRLDFNQEDERSGWEVVLGPCKARTLSSPIYSKIDPDHYNYKKSYTIQQDQNYDPDEIEVVVTPSGKKAVSYKRFQQYGRGDPREANRAFKTVEDRTKYLETQMTSLEDFVRKNRHLFPEETTIYQQVRFFQLNEEQLRQIGEPPDAEVYGVKIREKLVVPPGTEIAEILNRHYGKSTDVKVEYSNKPGKVETTEETETFAQIQERIRNKVEKEYENREKARLLTHDSYDVQQANKHIYRQEGYEHLHPHVTPQYLKSIYVNAGLSYEDHYTRRAGSVGSETESARSTTSRKSKRYDTAPSFTAKLRPKRCMEGQTVRFNCSISGLPPPEVIWFKGSKIINDSARFKLTNNYGLLSLEINNVEREDAGVYSVKAINPEGEVASSAPLEVQEVAPMEEKGDGTRKPWFVVETTNSWAEVGGKATLEAQAAGRPMPTFKWQKDNVTIHDSDRHRIYTDQQGNTKLVIRQSKESDTGLYFVIAENKAGVAKCAATLRVAERSMIPESERPRRSLSRETTPVRLPRRSFSRETTPSKLRERPPSIVKGTKPWFIRALPSEVKIRVGDPLTLTCVADGDPKPKLTWLKGVRELTYDKRKRVVAQGSYHLLEVERMLETEAGQYVVVAENALGRVSCTCWVNILPRRKDEDEDFEVRRLKLEIPEYEYETTPRGEYLMMRPRFVQKLPLEQQLSPGENLLIHCKVREGDPQFVRTGVDVDVKVKKPGGITEEIITMTKHGAEVSVKEVSKRPWPETEDKPVAPEAAPESSIAPKPVEETEGEKPEFTVALANKTVKLDSIAKLSVKITARPEPKIQWSKDGKDIKDGGRYEVFEEDGMYHLEVYDVEADDAGTYQCCARNDIGSATCSCTLTIAGGKVIEKAAEQKEDQPQPAKEEIIELAKEEPTKDEPKAASPKKEESESSEELLESEKESSVETTPKEEAKPEKPLIKEPEKEKKLESSEEPTESEKDSSVEPTMKEEVKPVEAPVKEPEKVKESESSELSELSESGKESSIEPAHKEEAKQAEVPAKEAEKEEESESPEEVLESEKESSVEPTTKEVEQTEAPIKETEKETELKSPEKISESEKESSVEATPKEEVKPVEVLTKEPEEEKELKSPEEPSESKKDSSVEPITKEEVETVEAPVKKSKKKKKKLESAEKPSESEKDSSVEPTPKEEVKTVDVPTKETEEEKELEKSVESKQESSEEPTTKEEAVEAPAKKAQKKKKKKKLESPDELSESEKASSVEPTPKEDIKAEKVPVKELEEENELHVESVKDTSIKPAAEEESKAVETKPSKESPKEESESEELSEEEEPPTKQESEVIVEEVKEETEKITDHSPKKEGPIEEVIEAVSEPTVETSQPPEPAPKKEAEETQESKDDVKAEEAKEEMKAAEKESKEASEEEESSAEELSDEEEEAEKKEEKTVEKETAEKQESTPEQKEVESQAKAAESELEKKEETESESKSKLEQEAESPESETKHKEEMEKSESAKDVEEVSEKDVVPEKTEEIKAEGKGDEKEGKTEESGSKEESEEESEIEEEDSKGAKSEPKQVVPSFAKPTTDLVVPEGASAKFECEVSGIPDPEITWTKDGISVTTGANVKVTVEGAMCTLCVESVRKEDEGEYMCTATNAAGSVSCSATLKIQETAQEPETVPASTSEPESEAPKPVDKTDDKPKEDEDSGTEDSEEDSSEPESDSESGSEIESQPEADKLSYKDTKLATPAFSKPLHNVTTLFGKEISLECKVSISPVIDVVWIRDGQE